MSEKLTKIDASPDEVGGQKDLLIGVPKTVEELDNLLAKYKKQNPKKYEKKEKNGEFDAFRVKLGGDKPKVKEPKEDPKKEESKPKAKKK